MNWLLIVLEHDKDSGPPFSQSKDRIKQLFSDFTSLKMLREKDIIAREPKFQADGCEFLIERVYSIINEFDG